ncbi:MAG: hypothetical protein JW942_09115 [Opitutales bacterium]|nr:hypothetical protein [Opitutales bacterium]
MMKECDIPGLAQGLIDWYWNLGHKRSGSYELPASGWLNQLCRMGKDSAAVAEALGNERPAMAIWGPSQTGKSTLISAYIDGEAEIPQEEQNAGDGTGLHWPGAQGFYFMAPLVADPEKLPAFLTRKVLNPYNKGMDGSSCLSRFVPGTTDGQEGTHRVPRPRHPVEMKMVVPRELWHALARGYSTECYGPAQGDSTKWNLDLLKQAIKRFITLNPAPRSAQASRDAYESLHDFCEILTDLAESDDPMFRGLGADAGELASTLRGLLEEPALVCNREAVLSFAGQILWDGYAQITDLYRAMSGLYRSLMGKDGAWAGKKVYCSLEATALFLNMGACNISYAPMPDNPKAPEAILKTLISKLGWREEGDDIIIECADGLPHRLGETPEAFCIIQGLVWELVIPINMANLADHPFSKAPQRPNALKEYLKVADILDFPGVGNETKSMDSKIVLDASLISDIQSRASAPDASGQDRERAKRCFSPQLFFKEVLKRGKTASIVSTYAKRLNIDAFSIFQGIRGYACPNADQLINGVKAWWKHSMPEYYRNQKGACPLPLNLTLTWWATQLNKAVNPNDSNIYGVIEDIVGNLGPIRDPGTCTTFAIHNHKSPDRDFAEITQDFNPGTVRYNNLIKEKAFAKQFASEISRKSFDQMICDLDTGGAEFFFNTLREQLEKARENSSLNRISRLRARNEEISASLQTLFRQHDIYPNPKPRDTRREQLDAFMDRLEALAGEAEPKQMQAINLALRNLLNVDFETLEQVPFERNRIGQDHIRQQFQQWINAQVARCAPDGAGLRDMDPDWRCLGIESPDKMREVLEAIAKSVAPDLEDCAHWLSRLASYNTGTGNAADLRRPLAIRMANLISFGSAGAHTCTNPDEMRDPDKAPSHEKAAFVYFVEPALKRLRALARRDVIPVKRPDQAGDAELVELCARYGVNPLKAS